MNPSTNPDTSIVSGLIVIVVIIAAFFIFREVVCWYFKLSEISKKLTEISNKLSK